MKNKKWIILVFVLILIIVLAVSLTKCGKESQKAKGKNNETENVTTTKAGTKAKKAVSSGQAEKGKPAEVTSNSGEAVTPDKETEGSTPASGEGKSGSEGGAQATASPAATPASSSTSSHTHSYGAWVIDPHGKKARSCSCGDVEITSATWVVDQPAWTEEVREPVYVNTWWIKFTDGYIGTYYSEEEQIEVLDNGDGVHQYYEAASWGNGEMVPDPSGATRVVYTIEHPEVGHWE